MDRSTLHKSKFEEFKVFLNSKDIPFREGKGPYQVLQVFVEGHGWSPVYDRHRGDHFTTQVALHHTVREFVKSEPITSEPTREQELEEVVATLFLLLTNQYDVMDTSSDIYLAYSKAEKLLGVYNADLKRV